MLGGIHTSIVTSTNVVLDLISSPADSNFYNQIREEVDNLLSTPENWVNAAQTAKLTYTDSAVRESLRRSPVLTKNILREVIKEDGVKLPDGQWLPKGAWLAVPSAAMHFDDRFYPDAEKYNPFRFVSNKVDLDKEVLEVIDENSKWLPRKVGKNQGLSNTSETFLGFGHGRHSW